MSYTAPPTFVADDVLAADELNVLSDDIAALYSVQQGLTFSAAQLRRAANQSIPDSTQTAISFDTETLDVGGWYSSGTNVVVPAGAIPAGATSIGLDVRGIITYASNTTGHRQIRLQLNGSDIDAISGSGLDGGDSTVIALSAVTTAVAGDILTLVAYQNSGGALNVTAARFTVLRLGVAS